MKKEELAKRLSSEAPLSPAEAADEVDRVVGEILTKLRRGQPANVPGVGVFRPPAKVASPSRGKR